MKAKDVHVGDVVAVKVSGDVQDVRIDSVGESFGASGRSTGPRFRGTNLRTGRVIGPFSVGRIRHVVRPLSVPS